MPPIESPGVVSLTKFFKVEQFVELLKGLLPGVDTARSVEAKLEEAGAIKELWNDLFVYEPKLEKSDKAAGQILLDDEMLRAARDDRPDAHLLVWCAHLLADSRLETVVREHLTDADGRIIPVMVNRNELQARLVQLGITQPDNPKPTTNILSYLETCKLLVLARHSGSVTGVNQFLPTAYAVPGLLSLIHDRASAWKAWFRPQDRDVLGFALGIGANHWLGLSRAEFRNAASPTSATQLVSRADPPKPLLELHSQLNRKGQVVLQGPPGTGKTHLAKKYIAWATGDRTDQGHLQRILDLIPLRERTVEKVAEEVVRCGVNAVWEIVQIHPSYEYTDFVRALVAEPVAGGVTFTPKHRILSFMSALGLELEKRGQKTELILVLDELNRGNIPAIFGELLYALEYRGEPVATPYAVDGSSSIIVPKSLQVIGTMNTADRSIAVIDYALRRRFVFLDVPASHSPLLSCPNYKTKRAQGIAMRLYSLVQELVVGATIGIQVGPSYFMPDASAENEADVIAGLADSLIYEVLPLLSEYVLEGEVEPDDLDKFKNRLGLGDESSGANSTIVIEKLFQLEANTHEVQAAELEADAS